MPGRYRDTHPWPLFGLRITTPRLELRMPGRRGPRRALRGRARGHPSGGRDAVRRALDRRHPGCRARSTRFLSFHWTARGAITPGALVAAVRRGRRRPRRRHPGAHGRGLRRQPQRLQRLVADGIRAGPRDRRRDARRGAAPRVRRPRRARGADIGLDRQRGLAARLAAARLRARRRAAAGSPRRADAPPALPPHARGVAAQPLRRHRAARSRALPARCSALHELAANLYNHATMATPTTTALAARRGCAAR